MIDGRTILVFRKKFRISIFWIKSITKTFYTFRKLTSEIHAPRKCPIGLTVTWHVHERKMKMWFWWGLAWALIIEFQNNYYTIRTYKGGILRVSLNRLVCPFRIHFLKWLAVNRNEYILAICNMYKVDDWSALKKCHITWKSLKKSFECQNFKRNWPQL